MYFDVHTHPDFRKRPYLMRAALDEIDESLRTRASRWVKRAALLGLGVILLAIVFFR